jgi:ABC-type phosphonate transport system ATPase subunit
MRISANPDDSHYHPNHANCRFYLAGAERNNVMTADEGARFAITYRLDEFGAPVRDRKTGEALTDRFHGDVRVDCSDWLRAVMESPQHYDEEGDTLSGAIFALVNCTP